MGEFIGAAILFMLSIPMLYACYLFIFMIYAEVMHKLGITIKGESFKHGANYHGASEGR